MSWADLTQVKTWYQNKLATIKAAITSRGGTAPTNYDGIEAAIATIPAGVEEIATAAEMDALVIDTNDGKFYKYVGTTTAAYTNGALYKVIKANASIDLTQIGSNKVWKANTATITNYDPTTMLGKWESDNYHSNGSNAVCKILVHGATALTVWINSYGETNYDFTIISKVDAAAIPTTYSNTYTKAHTRGFSKTSSVLNTTNYKKVEYTASDGLDGGEHFIYVVYHKDSSQSMYDDKGVFIVEGQPTHFEILTTPKGTQNITENGNYDVREKANVDVQVPGIIPTGSETFNSNGTYDVSTLATAVIDVAGGSSGHRIFYYHKAVADDGGKISINGGAALELTQDMPDASEYISASAFPADAATRFKIWGFDHCGHIVSTASSWARYRTHSPQGAWTFIEITRDEASAAEITLTADIDLEIYEGTCLNKGTLITMADGSKKRIEEIEVGDLVLGYNGKPNAVRKSQKGTQQFCEDRDIWIFENGYKIVTTYRHRFYNIEQQKMIYINEWKLGEHAVAENGEAVALLEHTHEDTPCQHFSLWSENENYFAGGLLAGNRYTPEINIKFDKEAKRWEI